MSPRGVAASGLPVSARLDVGVLARLFEDRSTSYKYFFFLALLDRVERAGTAGIPDLDKPIPLAELAVDMVLGAWFPHGFCRLSLGSQDQLQRAVDGVNWGEIHGSWIGAGGREWQVLRRRCSGQLDFADLVRYVPFRLIRPFFASELRGLPDQRIRAEVVRLANGCFIERRPFYCFTDTENALILHPDWILYFREHAAILRGWTRFHLAEYLQARNPSVPGIIDKLEAPTSRASLRTQTDWWRAALPGLGDRARCIYDGSLLTTDDLSLDHYLPWSFVAHDRLWNLVPVPRSVNSAKGSRIPDQRHIAGLAALQSSAATILARTWSRDRWLRSVEDYVVDLGIVADSILHEDVLREAITRAMTPLQAIAERQGFEIGWVNGG